MERSRSRLPAGAAALLLVLSVSGAAGAAALTAATPETVPLQKSAGSGQDRPKGMAEPATEDGGTSAETRDSQRRNGAEGGADEADQGGQGAVDSAVAGDACPPAATVAAGTEGGSASDAAAASGHGAQVSVVARDGSVVGGPRQNHGYCVSRVARGVEGEAGPRREKPRPSCDTATAPETAGAGRQNDVRNHGAAVSVVAQSDAVARKTDISGQFVEGSNCNHGHAVAAVARQNHGHAQRTAPRSERAGNGGTDARGHGATKVKAHGKTREHPKHRAQSPNGKGRGRARR